MDRNGPSKSWIDGLDLFEELQHADGRERNSKVRPAGEVELGDRSGGLGCLAGLLDTNGNEKTTFTNGGRNREAPKRSWTFGSSGAQKNSLVVESRSTHVLNAEFAYGVIHQDSEVFHGHPHVPVHPAALVGPVLVTLVLQNTAIRSIIH